MPYATDGQCDSIANPLAAQDAAQYAANAQDAAQYAANASDYRRMLGAKVKACDTFGWDRFAHEYLTSIWTFIGNAGVLLMIMESGMHVHFDKMKLVGKKATIVAIAGTGLPILCGYLVTGALF